MIVKKDKNGLKYQDSEWGAGYALSTPIPSKPPMTEEELLAHEMPFTALILWSGGNGPHEYKVTKAVRCAKRAYWPFEDDYQMDGIYIELASDHHPARCRRVYIGRERHSTKVWVLEAE